MALTNEERVELVLFSGREGWSYRRIADEFNVLHPGRSLIGSSTVAKVIRKFKEAGSIMDKPRSGRLSISIETKEIIMAKIHASPKKSIRRTSMELGIPKSTVGQVLKQQKFHPYKLQILHHLTEDDPNRRIEMCEWFSTKLNENIHFTEDCVLFSDEALFYVNGEMSTDKMFDTGRNKIHILLIIANSKEFKKLWFGVVYGKLMCLDHSFLRIT